MSRKSASSLDITHEFLSTLSLPLDTPLTLPDANDIGIPSSFRIAPLAQGTIATSACAASLYWALRKGEPHATPPVTVPLYHVLADFLSERLYTLHDSASLRSAWGVVGGLHKTKDGYVRIHDSLENHTTGTLKLLGLPLTATKDEVKAAVATWSSDDLETATTTHDVVIYKLRSFEEWDALVGATDNGGVPISVSCVSPSAPPIPKPIHTKPLHGIKVVEMTRVIAGPLAGKTLAHYGADVTWITSPNRPTIPALDVDFSRGKTHMQLDITDPEDKQTLLSLLADADVFLQSYRPGSLAARGLSVAELQKTNPNIICASLSAFPAGHPFEARRGFDSLIQTCSGMNDSEARHAGLGEVARPAPCQVLDHASGYLLASGISSALYQRHTKGGSWEVKASLSGMMEYLRTLGQHPGSSVFDVAAPEASDEYLEELPNGTFVKHAAHIDFNATTPTHR